MKTPEEMSAAIAAMRAEWQTICGEVMAEQDPEMDDDEVEAWMLRRHGLLKDFWTRHAEALAAVNPGVELPPFSEVDEKMLAALEANEKARVAEEALLHAGADAAESLQQLTEAALALLDSLEALTPEQWAEMDEEQRRNTYETIEMLREQRADMLAELPIERRRHWEKS